MAKVNPNSKKIHCYWCSKEVSLTYKGRLVEHKQSGFIRCVGSGQPAEKVEAHNKLLKKHLPK